MRSFLNAFWLSVPLCVSCAPAEAPRPASPEQPKVSAAATPRVDSAQVAGIVSVGPLPEAVLDTSLPLKALRDSLSVEGNPEPTVPMVFRDVCPGEVCSFGLWVACESIRLLSEPRLGAPVVATVQSKDTIITITGNQVVERAGKIIFRDTVSVDGEMERYLFTPADTLYPLSYDGEGYGTWFFHGRVGGGEWFFHEGSDMPQYNPAVRIVRERVTDWWVKAREAGGKEGWFKFKSDPLIAVDPHGHYVDSCQSK
jgi:hypothetical protein